MTLPFTEALVLKPVHPMERPSRGFGRRTAALLGALIVAGVLGVGGEAVAQGADRNRMAVGDSVRARLSGRMTVSAVFSQWQTGGILLEVDGFADPYPVDLENLERLDVYMPRTPHESFRNGALLGASAGLFIGAVAGLLLHQAGVIDDENAPPAELLTDALSFAGIGLAGGLLVGGFYGSSHPSSGWIRIQLPAS